MCIASSFFGDLVVLSAGTGFVATENLPETDESEGEGEGTREIEAGRIPEPS